MAKIHTIEHTKGEIIAWEQIRPQVKHINPHLAELLNAAQPTKNKLPLYKAQYAFGEMILKRGVFNFPAALNPLTKQLKPGHIPLFLIVNKTLEVYLDTGHRAVPLNFFKPGALLGLFEYLDHYFGIPKLPQWSATAGARSLFLLPKISNGQGLQKLRLAYKLALQTQMNHLRDHFAVCKTIAQHPKAKADWHVELLLFDAAWFDPKRNPIWPAFHDYLSALAWQHVQFALSKIDLSLDWERFADAFAARRLKPAPYLADQVKHILGIAAGQWPAFRPATDESMAPIRALQHAFIKHYPLKNHIPTFMYTYLPQVGEKKPVYYSLHCPTLLEGSTDKKLASTIMLDLRDLKLLLNTIQQKTNRSDQKNFTAALDQAQFDFFHVKKDHYQDIRQSHWIAKEDPAFQVDQEKFPHHSFCTTSPFWHGCIRIMT